MDKSSPTKRNTKVRVRNLSPEKLRKTYFDWSKHLERNKLNEASNYYLTKSLNIKEDAYSLYERSKIRCKTADIALALDDINQAKKYVQENNTNVSLQSIDCLYDKNKFEKAYREIGQNINDCSKNAIPEYEHRKNIISETVENTIGLNAGPCMLNFRKYYDLLDKNVKKPKVKNKNELKDWRSYKKLGKCDVTSNISLEAKELTIKEKAKKENYYNIYTQTYLYNSWKDVAFLDEMKKNNELIKLKQINNKKNKNIIETVENYSKGVECWMKMLQSRQPLYTKKYCANSNEAKSKAYKEKNLNYLQLSTRKDIFRDLSKVKKLRKEGNLRLLLEETDIFSDYIEKKTLRLMPRKDEFLHEIFNNVALAYCDQLKVPCNINHYSHEQQLYALFNIVFPNQLADIKSFNKNDTAGVREFIKYEKLKFFNKKNYDKTVRKNDKANEDFIKCKSRLLKLEKRLEKTDNIIERCFLYHEIGQLNFQQSKFDNVRIIINLLIDLSKEHDLYIWLILALILICKIEIKKNNNPSVLYDLLIEIEYIVTNKLTNYKLENFINTAIQLTNESLDKAHKHYVIKKIKIQECVNKCFIGRVTGYKYNVQYN